MKIRKDAINLIGKICGKLTIISYAGRNELNQILWLCKCECGEKCIKVGKRLISGKTTSCGCLRAKNLIGKRIGYWLVLKGIKNKKVKKWLCRCVCGVEKEVWANSLAVDKSSSCGCMNFTLMIQRQNEGPFSGKYQRSYHPLYGVFMSIRDRCYSEKCKSYKWYGGKGIKMCEDWLNSFEKFYDWAIYSGYESGLTIERIDSTKDYCPENCEWITRSENSSRAHREKHTGKIFNGWLCVEKVPFTTHSIFECILCKKRIQKGTYYVTSLIAAACKCKLTK